MSPSLPQLQIPMAGSAGKEAEMSPTSTHGDDARSNNSDEALEVVFDDSNSYRRKSSMVSDTPRNLTCFVHSLLSSQKRRHLGDLPKHDRPSEEPNAEKTRHAQVMESRPLDGKGSTSAEDLSHGGELGEGRHGGYTEGRKEDSAHAPIPTNSRLLTKKQLSDMAYGVRELSKHLGSLRIKPKVRTIFILTKTYDIDLIVNTRDVVKFLLSPERDRILTVYVEDTLEKHAKFDAPALLKEMKDAGVEEAGKRLKYWNNEMCKKKPHTFDFVVTMGGDGTVLYASWLFQQIIPPVLSFGLGSLGFMTKFDYSDHQDILTNAFRDGITVSLRLRFECTVMRSQPIKGKDGKKKPQEERDIVEELVGVECDNDNTHRPDGTYCILNDLVVDRGPNGTMSSTELFGDDEHFTNIQADGVCVATPTGSTAYNLAAGGSLCHPENPVILVTAIAAHTLSFRPIILPDTIVLRVAVPYNARSTCWASFDGRERVELQYGDYVSVSASRYPFATIMNTKLGGKRSEDWVRSISGKLGWNTREKQKGFKQWS